MPASRFHALSVLLAVVASAPAAGAPNFSSTYSDLTQCQPTTPAGVGSDGAPDGADVPLRCRGPGPYEVLETYSAGGTLRRVESPAHGFSLDLLPISPKCPFAFYGDKVEWRLADGAVFAVIARVRCYGPNPDANGNYDTPQNLIAEYLLVRGLSSHSMREDIDVATVAQPNQRARELADHAFVDLGPGESRD